MKLFFANDIQTYVGVAVPAGSTCILTLSQDAVTLVGNVLAQTRYSIPIISGSFSQAIWFNDELNPSGTGYHVQILVPNVGIVYDQQNVPVTGASFNLASFVPGSQSTATGTVLPTFETNGTANTVQSILNLKQGSNITLAADGAGGVTITGTASSAWGAITGTLSAQTDLQSALTTLTTSVTTETTRAETAEALLAPLTSAHLVTPLLGTPTSGNLANCTFPTLNQNTTGTAGGLSGNPSVTVSGINLTTGAYEVNGLAVAAPVLISPAPSSVTNTSLTSNVATYTCANSFIAGQLVSVTGCSAPYNVVLKPIVAASSTQFTVAITNANVGSAGASGSAYVPVEDTRGASTATAATPQFVVSDNAANPLVYVTEPFSAGAPTGSTTLTVATYAAGSGSVLNFITPGGGGVAQVMQNGIAYFALGYGSGLALLNAGGVSIETSIAGQNSHNFLTGNAQATFDMAQFTGSARSAPGSGFGRLEWLAGTTGGLKLVGYAGASTVGSVIADNVGNGRNQTEPCVAYVDATAQTATITTTTLYAVPAAGAGQYNLSWNAKVTTAAGVSSTLGPLTVTYVDPDGTTQTITCAANSKSGTQETSDTGNSTTTVLLGDTIMLNANSSTNITYAFAYASNAAAAMNYNLHIRLESM